MNHTLNELGQPVGIPLQHWSTCHWPPHKPMVGRYCHLEPTDPEHAAELYKVLAVEGKDDYWTYLPYGPFNDFLAFKRWLEGTTQGKDPQFQTIFNGQKRPVGVASYLRISPEIGSIEVGHIHFSSAMQKTPAATESMFLMMQRAFDELGYRRYEWKCDALNVPSRQAAERFGFAFEGVFRQHTMYKGRNRDTAWFSILDSEWPQLKQAFEGWLSPSNFDADGRQKQRLTDFRHD